MAKNNLFKKIIKKIIYLFKKIIYLVSANGSCGGSCGKK